MDAAGSYVAGDAEMADVGFVAHALQLADGDVVALVVADAGEGELAHGGHDDDCGDDDLGGAFLVGRHGFCCKSTALRRGLGRGSCLQRSADYREQPTMRCGLPGIDEMAQAAACRLTCSGDLGEELVGVLFFFKDGFEHGRIVALAEDVRPGAQRAVDGDLVMLDLLAGGDEGYVADAGILASLMLSSASVTRLEMTLQVVVLASPVALRRRLSTLVTWPLVCSR